MEQQEALKRFREWQERNQDWELICDYDGNVDDLYIGWSDLSKSARMSWVGKFGSEAKEAFEEFHVPIPKVDVMVLGEDLKLYPVLEWPTGFAMTVFRTKIDGMPVV